jgi:hypothetical protein
MADLKYSLTLDEEEITGLIQLLTIRMAQIAVQNPDAMPVLEFEAALMKKLVETRAAGLTAARAAGTLK